MSAHPPRDHDALSLAHLPRRRMRRQLRTTLTLTLAAQAAATTASLLLLQSPLLTRGAPDTAPAVVELLAAQLAGQPLYAANTLAARPLERAAATTAVAYAAVLDENRRVLFAAGPAPADLAPLPPSPDPDSQAPVLLGARHGLLLYDAPLPSAPSSPRRLLVALPDIAAQRARHDGAIAVAAGLLAGLAVPLPLALARFRRWSDGLRDLHLATRRLTRGLPPAPLAVAGSDEIAYLAIAFNDMAGRLTHSTRALLDANETLERRVTERTDELHRALEELHHKNTSLEDLTETALRFTDDVAHEFRTPLAVVIEFAGILSDGIGGDLTEPQAEYIDFIAAASSDLSRLVDDFLDSGKLRAQTLAVARAPHTANELLDIVWPLLESRAASAGVAIARRVHPDAPTAYADANKAARALLNLAVNALKFSPPDAVVELTAEPTPAGSLRLAVVDQGPGLTAQEIEGLAQRFHQTHSGRAASAKGFGLGLSIVTDLVDLNLGALDVTSTPGQGATFAFTLPAHHPASIADHFLDRAQRRDPSARVGLARVPADRADLARPHDLFVQAHDHAVLIAAATEDDWRARLAETTETPPTFPLTDARPPIVAALAASQRGARAA